MFYLIKNEFGRKVCLDKNQTDIYQDGVFMDCGTDFSKPTNIQKVRDINMNCNNLPGSNLKNVEVYTDFVTAVKLNLV